MRDPDRAADDVLTAGMKIGDVFLYQGRTYYLRGFDPMGLPDRMVILEDAETGAELTLPVAEVELLDEAEAEPPAGV
jgi:hypothetical protein